MYYATVMKIRRKAEASREVCRILLDQLAEIPGALTKAEDGRDLSRLLNEQVKSAEFLERWALLAESLVNEGHNQGTGFVSQQPAQPESAKCEDKPTFAVDD